MATESHCWQCNWKLIVAVGSRQPIYGCNQVAVVKSVSQAERIVRTHAFWHGRTHADANAKMLATKGMLKNG